ncbi:MAG: hypothetical protein IJX78_06385, partial [Bacilli bacterium]|nr:hypothetical protein [Bacilli bacterium]
YYLFLKKALKWALFIMPFFHIHFSKNNFQLTKIFFNYLLDFYIVSFLTFSGQERNLGIPVVATVENATCCIFLILPLK